MEPMDFVGPAKRIESIDISRAGAMIGVGEDEIHAVMEVEAGKSGFDRHNRPKMLFEPHVFYRNLSGAERQQAVAQGLAYPAWRRNYPADSYPRLCAAYKINPTAALMSASWGRGQILGENYALVGYENPQAMVEAFAEDEDNHLEAMIQYIINTNLDDDIRRHDWAGFAKGYNGPGYRKNRYDVLLAQAYAKWQNIPDTPWDGTMEDGTMFTRTPNGKVPTVTSNESYPTIRKGSKGFLVQYLQETLKKLNYVLGEVDSDFGKLTRDAVLAFRADNNIDIDGVVGPETWAALETAEKRVVSDERSKATEADLRKKGSTTIKATDGGKAGGILVAITGVIEAVRQSVGDTEGIMADIMGVVNDAKTLVGDNWLFVAFVVGFLVWYQFRKVSRARVEDHRSGANMGR